MSFRFFTAALMAFLIGGSFACETAKSGSDRLDSGIVSDVEVGVDVVDGGSDAEVGVAEVGAAEVGAAEVGADASSEQTSVQITGGGGRATSANFGVRIVVGVPVPAGRAQSTSFRAVVGTAAAQSAE